MMKKLAFAGLVVGILLNWVDVPSAQVPDFLPVYPLPTGNTLHDCTYNSELGELFAVGDVESVISWTDEGVDFSVDEVAEGPSPLFRATDYVNGTVAYALGHYKLIKTTDGGRSWTHVAGIPPVSSSFDWAKTIAIHPENPNIIWVGGMIGSDNIIFYSEDGGAFWTEVPETVVGILSEEEITQLKFCKNNSSWLIAITTDFSIWSEGKYYSSEDGGETWNNPFDTRTKGVSLIDLLLYFSSPPPRKSISEASTPTDTTWFVIVVGEEGTVSRSWDGITFDSTNIGTTADLSDVSIADSNHAIVVSMVGEVFYTTDGGDSWIQGTIDSKYLWLSAVAHKSVDTAYTVGAYGITFRTIDAGATWTELSEGTRNLLLSVHFPNPSIGYACGLNSTILKTSDAGQTWTELSLGVIDKLESVFFTHADTGYVVGTLGKIRKTVDGGTNWTQQTSGTDQNLKSIHFPTSQTGYAVGNDGVFKTTNGGGSWDNVDPTTTFILESTFFTDADTGLAVGLNGTIRKTTDGGGSWTTIPSGTMATLESVHFPDMQAGYIVGESGVMLKSTDGGESWNDVGIGEETSSYYSVHFTSPTEGYAVGMGFAMPGQYGTVLQTTDGGDNWTELLGVSHTANILSAVHFPDADTGYIVGYGGTIIRVGTDIETSIPEESITQHNRFQLFQNYPNPFNPITEISFSLPMLSNVKLEIFNIKGQKVTTLVNQHLSPGHYKYKWDGSEVASGVYFYRLQAGDFSQVKKMLLIK
jgi:photosystem II stability/assembly factor-like uncharacterized protein